MKSTKIAFVVDGQSFQKICLKDREDGKLETQQGPAPRAPAVVGGASR